MTNYEAMVRLLAYRAERVERLTPEARLASVEAQLHTLPRTSTVPKYTRSGANKDPDESALGPQGFEGHLNAILEGEK